MPHTAPCHCLMLPLLAAATGACSDAAIANPGPAADGGAVDAAPPPAPYPAGLTGDTITVGGVARASSSTTWPPENAASRRGST